MITYADVRKIGGREFIFWLFFVGAMVSPGLLVIWHYAPSLLKDCSSFLVILISAAATFPVVMFNCAFTSVFAFTFRLSEEQEITEKRLLDDIIPNVGAGSFVACFTLGLAFLISYFWAFSFRSFIKTCLLLEIVAAVIFFLLTSFFLSVYRKKKKTNLPATG